MRTATALINIENVTKKGDVFTVEYWDESHEGENNVTMEISEEALMEHIEFTGMNIFGDDFWASDVWTYLDANTHDVIKDYITANS